MAIFRLVIRANYGKRSQLQDILRFIRVHSGLLRPIAQRHLYRIFKAEDVRKLYKNRVKHKKPPENRGFNDGGQSQT